MTLRKKIYYALASLLSLGLLVHHRSSGSAEGLQAFEWPIQSLLLGSMYLILIVSVIEYFVLYRLRSMDKALQEFKTVGFKGKNKILELDAKDEIGRIALTVNDLLGEYEINNTMLQQSNAMYNSIVQDAPMLVCRFKPDGTITFANNSYSEAYGEPEELMVGMNVFELIEGSGTKSQIVRRSLDLLRPSNQNDTCFYGIPAKKGKAPVWHMWLNRAFFDEYGRVTEYQIIGLDVYQQTTEEIKNMMDNLLGLVYFVSKDGKLKYASYSNENVLGLKPSEMVGKSIYDFVHDDSHAYLKDQFNKRFANEEEGTSVKELRIKNSNDEYTWVQAAIDSIVESNGSVSDVAINAKDITEIKEANYNMTLALGEVEKIIQRVHTLEFIIDKSPVITIVWKEDGIIDYVSGNIALLGYERSEFTRGSITFEDIIHSKDKERVLHHIHANDEMGMELEPITYKVLKKDGSVQVVTDRTVAVNGDSETRVYYRSLEIIN